MAPRRVERPPVLLVFDQPLPEPLTSEALSSEAPASAAARFVHLPADGYLEGDGPSLAEGATVVNLCRSYAYLSRGYYVSLVAEARNQRSLPPLAAAEDAGDPFTYFRALQEAGVRTVGYRLQPGRRLLPKRVALGEGTARMLEGGEGPGDDTRLRLAEPAGPWLDVTSALGHVRDRRFRRVGSAIYRIYPFPLLRFRMFGGDDGWRLGRIQPLPVSQASGEEVALLAERLHRGRSTLRPAGQPPPRRPRLAVLFDPADATSPSDEQTLDKLARVAAKKGLLVERIGKGDLARLSVYDALLLRTVTSLNHLSFTFAQTAASLGMPVIDDPGSIIKCSNKIFLYELFRKHDLPIPETAVLSPRSWRREVAPLGWPVVLKVPDGTFSLAVKRAGDEAELEALTRELFKKTPLLLAQRFTPSEFDWRIGLLEGRPLWAARYHMAPGHWQIAHRSGTTTRYGRVEAVPLGEAPTEVLELAVTCAGLIGDGLYGVDIKETAAGPVLIEINDNPNLEVGVEDAAEGDRPYEAIADAFLQRIEAASRRAASDEGAP